MESPSRTSRSAPAFRPSVKSWFLIVLVVLAVGGVGTSVYFFQKYSTLKQNPNLEAQKEIDALVERVSDLMELPTDETPTVATVQDIEKLQGQAFFTKAQNGDKLLAYTGTLQAILYRPSAHKIINVASITIDQPVGQDGSEGAMIAEDLRVAYYNGTEMAGVAQTAATTVEGTFSTYSTVSVVGAARTDYAKTVVVDLTGTHVDAAAAVANLLGGEVGSLPEGEAAPDADLLVISGG